MLITLKLKVACNRQIHVRHFKCGTVSCNCAVIVREGNSILGLDICAHTGAGGATLNLGAVSALRYLGSAGEGRVLPDGSTIYRDGAETKFFVSCDS